MEDSAFMIKIIAGEVVTQNLIINSQRLIKSQIFCSMLVAVIFPQQVSRCIAFGRLYNRSATAQQLLSDSLAMV